MIKEKTKSLHPKLINIPTIYSKKILYIAQNSIQGAYSQNNRRIVFHHNLIESTLFLIDSKISILKQFSIRENCRI